MHLTYSPTAPVIDELERLQTFVKEHYPWHPVRGSVTHQLPTLGGTVTLQVGSDTMEVAWQPDGCSGPTMITIKPAGTSMITITKTGKCYRVVARPDKMLDVRQLVPLNEEHLRFVRLDSAQIPETLSRAIPVLVG